MDPVHPTHLSNAYKNRLARINKSIRSYCWSILAAQYETRKPILSVDGVAGGAQQRFVELVEGACIDRGGIEFAASTGSGTTVRDYESALQMARSKLDFGVGEGLYLIPSDMNLHDMSGGLNGYNNQLKIATSSLGLGLNTTVNVDRLKKNASPTPAPTPTPATKPTPAPKENTAMDDHDDLKAAVLVGAVAGFVAFKYYSA